MNYRIMGIKTRILREEKAAEKIQSWRNMALFTTLPLVAC
jgi:hypothetical protein